MVPGQEDELVGKFFQALERGEHLLIVSGRKIRASAISDEEGIATQEVRRTFLGGDEIADFSGGVSWGVKRFDPDVSEVDDLPVVDFLDTFVANSRESVPIGGVDSDRDFREAFDQGEDASDVIVVGVGEEDAGELEPVPLKIVHGAEVFSWIDDQGSFLRVIEDQVDEVPHGTEFVLEDALAGNPFGRSFAAEVRWSRVFWVRGGVHISDRLWVSVSGVLGRLRKKRSGGQF
jgi:hypothetical protein